MQNGAKFPGIIPGGLARAWWAGGGTLSWKKVASYLRHKQNKYINSLFAEGIHLRFQICNVIKIHQDFPKLQSQMYYSLYLWFTMYIWISAEKFYYSLVSPPFSVWIE